MAELRKDYVLDKYVIIATERAKRPDQFNREKEISDKSKCPFCPENESMIPGVIEQDSDDWTVRAIPNKFRAVSEGNPEVRTDNEFYTFGNAVGNHEVIIETPKHGLEMSDLEVEHIERIIRMYIKRVSQQPGYSALFKNKGKDAGASIAHSHTQLISYNIIPTAIKELQGKSKEFFEKDGKCPYCAVIEKETNSFRHISRDGYFFVYSPYASEYNLQFNLIPVRHISSILELSDEEITSLAENLKKYLKKLDDMGASYNVLFNNLESKPYNHFEIKVCPRLSTWAGFEKLTGTIINSVPPEDAAKFYRGNL